jgi:uncharacterized protein YxjI
MSVLSKNLFLVKEHVGMFKAANNYDIYDPDSNELIMECRENKLGFFTKLLRFSDYKRMTPFNVEISDAQGNLLLSVSRGVSIFLSDVKVHDGQGVLIGGFKQKLFSIGGKFDVQDPSGQALCHLKGSWTGWNFRFLAGERQLAQVSKEWAGLGKEMFTSADNYVLNIADDVPEEAPVRKLILAAVMCIDMVLKE